MRQIQCALLIFCLSIVFVEPRVQLQRGLLSKADIESINQPHPYIFPAAARGRSVPRQQIEAEDYEDDEDTEYRNLAETMPIEHRESSGLSLPKEHSGGILVPDGIIEVQGETVYDEKTGQATLVVPMQALAAIPDGSIVALLQNKGKTLQKAEDDNDAEERANRVYVRRRNTGSRLKLRGGSKKQADKKRSSSSQKKPQRRRRPQTELFGFDDMYVPDKRSRPSSKGKPHPVANRNRRRNYSKGKRRRQPLDYFSSDY